MDGARRGTVESNTDVCNGHVCSLDDATVLHSYGDNATFSGNAYVIVGFTLIDDQVVNGACRGTVESDAVVCDGHVGSTNVAADLHPNGENTSWRGIVSVSVLFNRKADGAVDGARLGTVDSDADVCEGQFGSTDDATDPHPYGDNASFSGNASVSVLVSLRDDGVVDGARRGLSKVMLMCASGMSFRKMMRRICVLVVTTLLLMATVM